MQPNELINGPVDLLMLAVGLGIPGVVLFGVANLIMKMIGMDINEYARETDHYRNLGFAEQFSAFFSDVRNIPALFGILGLFLMFGGVVSLVVSGGWFLLRAFSG